jgi:AcrR family transcriptional regulator
LTGEQATLDDTTRQRVLDAAVEVLLATSVGAFTVEAVAARSGVDLQIIRQVWPNAAQLLTAALRAFGDRHIPIPDTGTLAGDLLAFARSYVAMVNSDIGRRMLDTIIVKRTDWELTDSRAVFLAGRQTRIGVIIQRGIERGECPPETDPTLTMDMLGIGLCLPPLYYDQPVSDEHCQYIVDTLLYGIAHRR